MWVDSNLRHPVLETGALPLNEYGMKKAPLLKRAKTLAVFGCQMPGTISLTPFANAAAFFIRLFS